MNFMKLKSLIRHKNKLLEAEIEVQLIPGIPQIHFTGLADRAIKESFYRIKSAFKSCGYQFPTTQQVIVNIKPNHLQKTSCGLEFAVAMGILIQTKQIHQDFVPQEWIIYGELGLDGDVHEPADISDYKGSLSILSGKSKHLGSWSNKIINLRKMEIIYCSEDKLNETYHRPDFGLNKKYTKEEADFLFLMSVGKFHALLAGDAGAGKSTLARSLLSFLSKPDKKGTTQRSQWRPLISPHQTITQAAFIGGGATLHEGEIERVAGGILLLDELLEFKPEVIETLRGPMVGEPLRLVRSANEREIESDFQVVATTNLCPCGMWMPGKINLGCRFSRTKCRKYLEKLSGPIVDRFGMILFLQAAGERIVPGNEILTRIEDFKLKPNCENKINKIKKIFYSDISERRWNFLKQVALIFASEQNVEIKIDHFKESEKWTLHPFQQLAKGMD